MNESRAPLVGHLAELRLRIIYCLVAFVLASVIAWQAVPFLISYISLPAGKLVFLQPSEAFFTYLRVAFWGGVFLALPVITYNIWKFIAAGLLPVEKNYVYIFAPFSFLLFLAGAAFGFFAAIPLAVKFLVGFGAGWATPMLSVGEYVSFFGWLLLVFGLMFELPLVLLFLVKLRIVNAAWLARYRRHAILTIFITAAIVTPTPDAFTQLLLAGPLIILYEIGVFLSRFV